MATSSTPDTKEYVLREDASDGAVIGKETTSLFSFHGATPSAQRSGAAQAAVTTTASTASSPVGYSTTTQADAIVTLLNEIRATLVAKGIMKGAA